MATLSDTAANAAANAVTRLLDGGDLYIFDDAGKPLAELRYATPAFRPAVGGVARANPLVGDNSAVAGIATKLRAYSRPAVLVFTGTVGTSNADLILNSTSIEATATVDVTSHTYRQPKA